MRWAACRAPPDEVDTYPETARPKLARSLPPECAKRVKLPRALVNRLASAGAGIAGRFGGAEGTGGGTVGSPTGVLSGAAGTAGAAGASAALSDPSQVGTNGVPPPGPPYADDVPISDLPSES